MRSWPVRVFTPILAGHALLLAAFWSFTADDAYIPVRYAHHLVNDSELTFNLGEQVSAMTSPLHALLLAACEFAFGSSVTSNKVLGLIAVLGAALAGALALRRDAYSAVVFTAVVLLSPFVAVWTVGGLETPFLLLLVTLLVVLSRDSAALGPRRTALLALLVGLAFLLRYDSILFTGPLLLWLAWRQRSSIRGLALLTPAGVALVWLGFSAAYFGDVLPTSYYVKQPSTAGGVARPGLYEVQFLLLSGIALVLVPVLWSLRSRDSRRLALGWLLKQRGWVVLGLAAMAAYGLFAGMQHMMFSYRLFVPYLPAAAFVALELRGRGREAAGAEPGGLRAAAPLLAPLAAINAAVAVSIYSVGLNPSLVGEYRHESLRSYTGTFIPTMVEQADEMEADWKRRGRTRPVRILTFVAGIIPHRVKDAYIFERLVSYRHECGVDDQARSTDYLHGPDTGLSRPPYSEMLSRKEIEPVSSREIDFNGRPLTLVVYRLPNPEPIRLPDTIDGPCG